jgi:hypothetical protein
VLSIPVFAQIEGMTIFRDDNDPFRFYYLPRNPRIMRDTSGKPMFTFLIAAFGRLDRTKGVQKIKRSAS